MSRPSPINARQMQASTCALSITNHLKKINTQLATLASLGEPVAIDIHGADIRRELVTMHNLIESMPLFASLNVEESK